MRVRVRLFAGVKELVGQQELVVQLPDGASVRDLERALAQEYPQLAPLLPGLVFAVAEEYRTREFVLHEDDEVALIPPISGGSDAFAVTEEALDPRPVIESVHEPGSGAVVLFLGVVRDEDQGRRVRYLEYEAYRPMAVKELRRVGQEVAARWPSVRVAMRHRVGRLAVGETALVVAVAAPHREEAFAACGYTVDRIKAIVPIWKKEVWEDGEAWLEGRPVQPDDA